MITVAATTGAACTVTSPQCTFTVFPAKPLDGQWCLMSHPLEELKDKQLSWPGEYDFGDVTVRAIGQQDGRQVSFGGTVDGLRCAFIGSPLLEWSDAELESLGDIDILLIAAEHPKRVLAIVESVDPRVVILYKTSGGDLPGTTKALGLSAVEAVSEFKVKPGTLPTDSRQVVVLG